MSKFYTNIVRYGNNILYRGYDNGMPIQEKIAYRPHLFLPTKDDTEYRVFKSNLPVKKKEFGSITDMRDFVEQFGKLGNFDIYGCSDIVRQFTGNKFRGDIDWDYSQVNIYLFDIETEVSSGFPDPKDANERIQLITMMNHHTQDIHVWSLHPIEHDNPIFKNYERVNFESFETERQLLKSFVTFFATVRIDILSGWNSEFFDVPYIVNRIIKVLGPTAHTYLSPWRQVKERIIKMDDGSVAQTYDILGITHLDYLEIYKKFNPSSKESFKLDYIAEVELGERKVELPGDTFKESYEKHWDIFAYYNVVDVTLLHKMENKLLQIRLAMQLGFVAKCQFSDVVSAMRLWESIIYNYFLDLNVVEEFGKGSNKKHSIVGAYVHEPIPGKYGWTVSIDATALYPSIMMQNNISPETIVDMIDLTIDDVLADRHTSKVPSDCIVSANGLVTTKKNIGFIPTLVKQMFDLRKKTKTRMLEKKKELEDVKNKLRRLGVDVK